MGTRHLIAVKVGGEYKVAQYGQWDGYPTGQGVSVLSFLRAKKRVEKLRENAKTTRFIDEAEHTKLWTDLGLPESKDGYVTMDDASSFAKEYPQLSRDTGAGVLKLVANTPGLCLTNSIEFAADSLFCEWAYVIDFDKRTFEVFKGFNTKPLPNGARFSELSFDPEHRKEKYHPVKRLRVWRLNELPTKKEFLTTLEKLSRREED